MLRMTKQSDYGILLLAEMARERGGRLHSARDLAEVAGLPAPTASKILKALARAGLIESQRGVNGGYRLARPAAAITVAQVISGLEGPIGVAECTPVAVGACEHEPSCRNQTPMRRVNQVVARALETVSLADIVSEARPRGRAGLSLSLPV